MVLEKNVLYGGFEGTDEEICLHCQSLGEGLLRSLNQAANRIVLVNYIALFVNVQSPRIINYFPVIVAGRRNQWQRNQWQ